MVGCQTHLSTNAYYLDSGQNLRGKSYQQMGSGLPKTVAVINKNSPGEKCF